jgi:hypothetical protein
VEINWLARGLLLREVASASEDGMSQAAALAAKCQIGPRFGSRADRRVAGAKTMGLVLRQTPAPFLACAVIITLTVCHSPSVTACVGDRRSLAAIQPAFG